MAAELKDDCRSKLSLIPAICPTHASPFIEDQGAKLKKMLPCFPMTMKKTWRRTKKEEVSLIHTSNPFASWTGYRSDHVYAAYQQPLFIYLSI